MRIDQLRTISFITLLLFVASACSGPAESGLVIDEIHVENVRCEMCKATIESALIQVDGVRKADLSMTTHLATISHIQGITRQQLVTAITESGYHADNQKRNESAYEELPVCCK